MCLRGWRGERNKTDRNTRARAGLYFPREHRARPTRVPLAGWHWQQRSRATRCNHDDMSAAVRHPGIPLGKGRGQAVGGLAGIGRRESIWDEHGGWAWSPGWYEATGQQASTRPGGNFLDQIGWPLCWSSHGSVGPHAGLSREAHVSLPVRACVEVHKRRDGSGGGGRQRTSTRRTR